MLFKICSFLRKYVMIWSFCSLSDYFEYLINVPVTLWLEHHAQERRCLGSIPIGDKIV